jgi:hypothetical protein
MTRNLKALGLALIAVFAMSAVAASAAQATAGAFSWASGTTKLMGSADPEAKNQTFTVTPGAVTASFTCDEVDGEASVSGTTATEVTAPTIVYSEAATTASEGAGFCKGTVAGIPNVKTTVKMNGCGYKFTSNTTVGTLAEGKVEGTVHIECQEEKVIEVSAAGCLVKVGPQTVGRITYTTKVTGSGVEDVTAHAEVGLTAGEHNNAIDYSTTGITCGNHPAETDGTYAGTVTFTGTNASQGATNVTVT